MVGKAGANQISVTSAVRRQIKEDYEIKRRTGVELKGCSTKVTLYEILKESG